MLEMLSTWIGRRVWSPEGEVGRTLDLLFDDRRWVGRIWVVHGLQTLGREEIFLPTAEVGPSEAEEGALRTGLSSKALLALPNLRERHAVKHYYRWPHLWKGAGIWGVELRFRQPAETQKLHSAEDLMDYGLATTDGKAGYVDDFLFDPGRLSLEYAMIIPRRWWPTRAFLLPPYRISAIDAEHRLLHADLSTERLHEAPSFDPSRPLTPEEEDAVRAYFTQAPHSKKAAG